ncbi:hypothetical protein FRC06_000188 [Ceratobasidium sp. 370]|nr:hypothetical protein FRC06_000188 [Ceratobasidium sp. 370]
MSSDTPCPVHVQHPTKCFEEYNEGDLVNFSKSVGWVVKPSTTETELYPVEQVQNQKAIAAARGNASQPDLLPPKKRKADDNGTLLFDHQLDDISDEDGWVEWLCQVWEEIQSGGIAKYNPPPPPAQGFQINSGLTKVLDPQKSGQTSASKLI